MVEILTDTQINASQQQVWGILADFEHYPLWNTFTITADGPLQVGAVIKLHVVFPNGQNLTTTHTIEKIHPPHELCWRKLNIPLLLWSRRCQTIDPLAENQVIFRNREYFYGPLAGVANFFYGRQVRQGLVDMALALKERAENGRDNDV